MECRDISKINIDNKKQRYCVDEIKRFIESDDELEGKIANTEGQTEENYKALADLKSEKIRLETRQKIIM